MTTTAEQRAEEASAFLSESERLALADELSNRKLKFADVVMGQYEMLSEIEMDCIVALLRQPNLTQALHQAQNDKLEEAAAHFERYSAAFSGRSFAATLRALKSKDTPIDLVKIGMEAFERGLNSKRKD